MFQYLMIQMKSISFLKHNLQMCNFKNTTAKERLAPFLLNMAEIQKDLKLDNFRIYLRPHQWHKIGHRLKEKKKKKIQDKIMKPISYVQTAAKPKVVLLPRLSSAFS